MVDVEQINWVAVERSLRKQYKKPAEIRSLVSQIDAAIPKPRLNKYLPPLNTNIKPISPKQEQFLLNNDMELFYGGAAGGGKSSSILLGALQYCDVPNYSALILRRTFGELTKPGALISLAKQWLRGTDAQWSAFNKWFNFPSGAILAFGYLDNDDDKWQYQSAAYQSISVDELTEWPLESTYRFMFSRLRKLVDMDVPLRMRSGSNPIGPGAVWAKQRFIIETGSDGKTPSRKKFIMEDDETGETREYYRSYMPAKLDDNPYLDRLAYRASLSALSPYLIEALERGDWDVKPPGKMFRREWFSNRIPEEPIEIKYVRFWDLAATAEEKGGNPSWTCGVKLGYNSGRWFLANVRRQRLSPYGVEQLVKATAEDDGPYCEIVIEEEGGSAGKNVTDHYIRALPNRVVRGWHPTGPKEHRAAMVANKCEAGHVIVVQGDWVGTFLDELEQFPPDTNKIKTDQVDAFSGAYIAQIEKNIDLTGIVTVGERIRPDW